MTYRALLRLAVVCLATAACDRNDDTPSPAPADAAAQVAGDTANEVLAAEADPDVTLAVEEAAAEDSTSEGADSLTAEPAQRESATSGRLPSIPSAAADQADGAPIDGAEADPSLVVTSEEAAATESVEESVLAQPTESAMRSALAKNKRNGNPFSVAIPSYRRDTEQYGRKNSCLGHRYEKHQYARACFRIYPNGRMMVWSKFTNNKKIDGDNFTAVFAFKDSLGKTVTWVRHAAGINGNIFGGVEDVYKRTTGRIDSTAAARIRYASVRWGRVNTKDDGKIVKDALRLACTLIGCTGDDDETEKELKPGG